MVLLRISNGIHILFLALFLLLLIKRIRGSSSYQPRRNAMQRKNSDLMFGYYCYYYNITFVALFFRFVKSRARNL